MVTIPENATMETARPLSNIDNSQRWTVNFPHNAYSVSVVTGDGTFTNTEFPYEAVIRHGQGLDMQFITQSLMLAGVFGDLLLQTDGDVLMYLDDEALDTILTTVCHLNGNEHLGEVIP